MKMKMKKSTLAIALTGALLFTLSISQAVAHEKHCDIEETELGDIMKYMKSELRGYNKGFKADNANKMQKHLTELLLLSERAKQYMPVMVSKMEKGHIKAGEHDQADDKKMDHSKMAKAENNAADMSTMPNMEGMTSGQHQQYMEYRQGLNALNDSFKSLSTAKDKAEIKSILSEIKQQNKKGHKQFRQDCS